MDSADARTADSGRPMSFAQRRLWFLDSLRPGTPDDLLPLALRVRGDLDEKALTGAFEAVIARHEVLRTRYPSVDGEPVAVVEPVVEVPWDHRDLGSLPPLERESRLTGLIAAELVRPLPLDTAPPLRLTLVRLGDQEHLLLIVVHHIAFDFFSWPVLTRELAAGYRARTGGGGAEPEPLPLQYADAAVQQAARLTGPRGERQLAYWRERLAGLEPLELPADRPRPAIWDGAADIARFTVPAELAAGVDRLAREHRATRFMVLLAAFQATLGRLADRDDVAVGTPVSGRGRPPLGELIGLFVNSVVLRTSLTGSPSFAELLGRVRADTLAALTHAELPFERVVTELAQRRDLSRNPLFQVSFQLLPLPEEPDYLPGLDAGMVSTPASGTALDLALDLLSRSDGRISGRMQYATALFDPDTAERIGAAFVTLLAAAVAEPDAPLARLTEGIEGLPARERRRLLARGNDTALDVPDVPWTELFARQVSRTPGAVAVSGAGGSLTYGELDTLADRLAHRLADAGAGPGVPVGVFLERGPGLVTALLAVHRAGAVYLPLDPDYPPARIGHLLQDSGAGLIVSERALTGRLAETVGGRASGARTLLLDDDEVPRATGASRPGPPHRPRPDELAYIFYTSGSTGQPKGVLVEHRSLTHFLAAMAGRLPIGPGATFLGITTVSFDPSLMELCLPLTTGARLLLADREQARDPQRMAALIDGAGTALVQATPVTLRMLLDCGWRPGPGLDILSGGEKLHTDLAVRLADGGARVWDLYGPTETTVWSTTSRLDPRGRPEDWRLRGNTRLVLLDARGEPVAEGAVGEIHIGGTGLGWGYHGRPAQSAAAFVPDPFADRPGARLYRTGDLARRRPDGSLEILGRADHQVKIRGHRIEPGEIESALLALGHIRAAVVRAVPHPDGDQRLAAYLVMREAAAAAAHDELRTALLATLPDYMVPEAFVTLEALPRTPNGKVDRLALPPVADWGAVGGTVAAPPRTDRERAVAAVWEDVLGIREIGADHDFFQLGGHSLLATRVSVRLRAALGIDVPVRALFEHPTVAALAAALPGYPTVASAASAPVLGARRRTRRPVADARS
ncbi:non-ribosomal peptide synthase [Streptomyces sp. SID8356]|uniref:non-ribosomal peptide synthetase n=1 Tax=unclassified Streptomyces TaxID=2593676 RepID=UPI00039D3748|nr:non-ribosomal peptide synthetase [Streptomyces sp. CcalMP-8W]MYT37360.1 non-ribosomal peptide synthase [Streptomyces sp. SID8356]